MKHLKRKLSELWDLRFVIAGLLALALLVSLLIEAWTRYPRYVQASAALFVLFVFGSAWLRGRRNERRGWRVTCASPVGWAYEEKRDGVWEGITFPELGDFREPPHVIDLGAASKWEAHPAWMRDRRDEIITRVRSELKRPQFVLRENA